MIALIAGLAVALTSSHQIPASPGLTKTQANNTFKPESKAQKIRRLLAAADISNPSINPPLAGATPWFPSTAYALSSQVSNAGLVYTCSTAGTSASGGGPSGWGTSIVDGTVTWTYTGVQTAPTLTVLSTLPSYLGVSISTSDSRIRYLCSPVVGLGGTVAFPAVNSGLGGNGAVSSGAVVGATSLTYGSDFCCSGYEIVTDAPILCFRVGNSTTSYSVIVRDAQTNAYISSQPVPVNVSIGGDNFFLLDFSSVGSQLTGGAALTPTVAGSTMTGWSSVTPGFGYSASFPPDIYFSGVTGSLPSAYSVINSVGQLTTPTITYGGNITSGTLSARIVTGRRKRKITILSGTAAYFKGLYVSSIDTVWSPNNADHETIAFLGDSWVSAVGVTDVPGRQSPMCVTFAQLMGADNWIVSGAGSTDYACPMCPYNSFVTSGAIGAGTHTVTVESINATMGGGINYPMLRGDPLTVDFGLSTQETIQISNVTGTNITATFARAHSAGCAVTSYIDPFFARTSVTSGAITASSTAQTINVGTTNNAKGASSGITVNSLLWVDSEGNPEVVKVTGIAGTSITGVFARSHAAGCSLAHTGSGYRVNHFIRVGDVGLVNADIIVIGPAGLNDINTDNGASAAVIQNECLKIYSALREANPATPIIWYGTNSTATSPQQVAVDQGIYNAIYPLQVTDQLLLYVPVVGDPNGAWGQFFSSANGYLNPGTGHPSVKGFQYYGTRMLTDSVRNFLRNLVTSN